MKALPHWKREEGLSLVELLAGLLLFSVVITMLYGVLLSAISLQQKVSAETSLRNHADLLVNNILQSLKDMDQVIDVTEYFRQKGISDTDVPSAIWMTELVNEGTESQTFVHYLLLIQRDSAHPSVYHLIRETYTNRDTTISDTHHINGAIHPDNQTQLDDSQYPLVSGSRMNVTYYEGYEVESVLDLHVWMAKLGKDGKPLDPYEFHSRINVN